MRGPTGPGTRRRGGRLRLHATALVKGRLLLAIRAAARPLRAGSPARRRDTRPSGTSLTRGFLRDERGQMVVEMAVVTPVMIVVAIVCVNLMWYLEATARFDRLAPDAVMAVAVSPAGGDGGSQEHAVTEALQEAMSDVRGVSVTVSAHSLWDDFSSGVGFTMVPHLTRYECTMYYEPWPSSLTVAGVQAGVPARLERTKSFTVDRYRSGVLF